MTGKNIKEIGKNIKEKGKNITGKIKNCSEERVAICADSGAGYGEAIFCKQGSRYFGAYAYICSGIAVIIIYMVS